VSLVGAINRRYAIFVDADGLARPVITPVPRPDHSRLVSACGGEKCVSPEFARAASVSAVADRGPGAPSLVVVIGRIGTG
jgi:hypothetical protein